MVMASDEFLASLIYPQVTNLYSSQKMFSVFGPEIIYYTVHTTIIAHEFLWKQLKNIL